jgi:hypothetical protein
MAGGDPRCQAGTGVGDSDFLRACDEARVSVPEASTLPDAPSFRRPLCWGNSAIHQLDTHPFDSGEPRSNDGLVAIVVRSYVR